MDNKITMSFNLPATQRVKSQRLSEMLFDGKSRSMAAFPLRVIYRLVDKEDPAGIVSEPLVKILVSVPKRHLHHAVDRNRVKRQVREAFRKNKDILYTRLSEKEEPRLLTIAFVWLDPRLHTSEEIERKVKNLIKRMSERL